MLLPLLLHAMQVEIVEEEKSGCTISSLSRCNERPKQAASKGKQAGL